MKHLLSILWVVLLATCLPAFAAAMPYVFTRLSAQDGLSDNQVQHILQLPDGRMVFTTRGNINLYDGMQFRYIHRNDSDVYGLKNYTGAYHVYVGEGDLLWVKDWKRVWCLDLRHERYLERPGEVFRELGITEEVNDLFVDSGQRLWLVTGNGLWDSRSKRFLPLPVEAGILQDVETDGKRAYLFFNTGILRCHALSDGRLLYQSAAYPPEERPRYAHTSLVVKGPDGNFYQIRVGRRAALFAFSPRTRQWRKLMDATTPLHTLIVPDSHTAYISSLNGIWEINLHTGRHTFQSTIATNEGTKMEADLNTIYQDRQRGIWLGTGNQGLLYAHPGRFAFLSAATMEALPVAFPLMEKAGTRERHRRGIHGRSYNDVYTDSRGWVWAGTADGLRLFLPGADTPRNYYTEDGLGNNFIHAIAEDDRGRIWVSTSYGISRILVQGGPDSLLFTAYRREDGTLKEEYRNQDVCVLEDGRILMGGMDGWTLFHPDSVEIPACHFRPLLTGLSLHGQPLGITADSAARSPLLPQAPPYVTHYEFDHDQNSLGFHFSALNYAWPAHTWFRYRLIHDNDSTWYMAGTQKSGGLVDGKGNLHLSFAMLSPGHYRLQVMASTRVGDWQGQPAELSFIIHAPWWRTRAAYASYALLTILAVAGGTWLYVRQSKRRIQRQHKEEILLLRIRNLLERCDDYERQRANVPDETPAVAEEEKEQEEPPISPADSEFLNKAVSLVEANVCTPGYSVEQLSKDLCMERSGLYKKLSTLLDTSPSLFIRNVRLKRAADLILEGKMSITEIAETVGFSSTGYMSKCFIEVYGCRPSEYAARKREAANSPG